MADHRPYSVVAVVLIGICLAAVVSAHPFSSDGNLHGNLKPLQFEPEKRTGGTQNESWAYVTVRPKAHMFFWLYETTHHRGAKNRPLILWLQGGPGGSGVGFGNFGELGPLDTDLKPRETTWLQTASLLFIDNPVGAGYSYVDSKSHLTKNLKEICDDLLVVMKYFAKNYPLFQETPFYIFSESYGGKMTAGFSAVLQKAISQGELKMNFKGFAMGDSWIDPVSYTDTWGPYLYSTSVISKADENYLAEGAKRISDLVKEGKWEEATEAWGSLESKVENVGGGVNFYNILKWGGEGSKKQSAHDSRTTLRKLYDRHVGHMQNGNLDELMNGPIKKKLGIIPKHVRWGGQSEDVFMAQSGDFMKSVTSTVNDLINDNNLTVVIYNGQLDLICDTLGTSQWFYKTADIAKRFMKAEREAYRSGAEVYYFRKALDKFQFYWIMDAGHMVPQDNGPAALAMVNKIIGQ